MKSLLLKDIYNLAHNAKQMIFILLFLAFCMIPSIGTNSFIVVSGIICSMMTVTTFSMDERSNWSKYALIMPLSRKNYVQEKYVICLIFTAVGTLFGTALALILGMISGNFHPSELLFCAIAGLLISLFFGSLYIPVLFRFGAEKARMIMIAVVFIPSVIAAGIISLINRYHITITAQMEQLLFLAVPVGLLLVFAISYYYSMKCFRKMEF